jgi:hypothetical protein
MGHAAGDGRVDAARDGLVDSESAPGSPPCGSSTRSPRARSSRWPRSAVSMFTPRSPSTGTIASASSASAATSVDHPSRRNGSSGSRTAGSSSTCSGPPPHGHRRVSHGRGYSVTCLPRTSPHARRARATWIAAAPFCASEEVALRQARARRTEIVRATSFAPAEGVDGHSDCKRLACALISP